MITIFQNLCSQRPYVSKEESSTNVAISFYAVVFIQKIKLQESILFLIINRYFYSFKSIKNCLFYPLRKDGAKKFPP